MSASFLVPHVLHRLGATVGSSVSLGLKCSFKGSFRYASRSSSAVESSAESPRGSAELDGQFLFFLPCCALSQRETASLPGRGSWAGREGGRDSEERFFLSWETHTSTLPDLSCCRAGLLLVWQHIPALTKLWKVRENNCSSPFI